MAPLQVVTGKLPKKTSNLEDIREYRILLRNDATTSHITFVKEQGLEDAAVSFSFYDGIQKLNYKKRPSANSFTIGVGDSIMEYIDNSLPTGVVSGKLPVSKFDYPDEAREDAFLEATVAEEKKEINLTVNKGHYLEIGNVITIHTPEYPELIGKHRIMSKDVSVSGNGMKCNLKLSRESAFLADYLGEA